MSPAHAMQALANRACFRVCRRWDTGHGQSWDNSMAAMAMFSMADLPSMRSAKVRRSRASASHSRPRSAAETSGFGGSTASADPDLIRNVARMKAKTDRLEAMLQQAKMEGVQAGGDVRTLIREEVQRQLRNDSARSKSPDGRQSHSRASNTRRSSAGLSRFSRHSHGTRRRQVRHSAQRDWVAGNRSITTATCCVETVVRGEPADEAVQGEATRQGEWTRSMEGTTAAMPANHLDKPGGLTWRVARTLGRLPRPWETTLPSRTGFRTSARSL